MSRNSVQAYLFVYEIDELAAMNAMTDAGIISDLAVGAGDIAHADSARCLTFLSSLKDWRA